jgi:hypothetical protein
VGLWEEDIVDRGLFDYFIPNVHLLCIKEVGDAQIIIMNYSNYIIPETEAAIFHYCTQNSLLLMILLKELNAETALGFWIHVC